MSGRRDWDKDRQRQLRAAAQHAVPTMRPYAEIRQTLEFVRRAPEKKAGNWVVLPVRWDEMVASGAIAAHLLVHRKSACQRKSVRLDLEAGDRQIRISNEVVEMLGLRFCEVCAGHVTLH
jgi:hypothetical protein